MSGCEWFLGATGEFCGAPVEAEGLILCAWHANCEDGNDSHRGPNQPTAQVSGWHPFMRQLGSNMCVCGAADSDPVHTSQAPEPTALDTGGSEGMVTAPPAVTIPEDQRWAECHRRNDFSGERVVSTPTTLHRAATWSADYHPTHKSVVVRLVTADEWDAICSRLAKLDRIEATRRAVKAGPAIPSPSDWEAFIDALDGEP